MLCVVIVHHMDGLVCVLYSTELMLIIQALGMEYKTHISLV